MPGLAPWFPQRDRQNDSEFADLAPLEAQAEAAARPLEAWPIERYESALAAFDRDELPPTPNHPPILAKLITHARILIDKGELRLASCLLRNALMRDARSPDALRWMAFCMRERGDLANAAKCARALAKVSPDESSWFILGEILYDMERDDDARVAFQKSALAAKADCSFLFDIFKMLGNVNVRRSDFDAAEECYNKAFAINPQSDVLMVNYGTLEIQRDNIDAALARFREAVEVNDRNDKAWVGLALVHRHMGDATLAWANLERALDMNPTNRTALRLSIEWGAQGGDFALASRRLQIHLGIEGEDAEMSHALAKIFAFERRYPEAQLEMERAFALDPGLAGAPEGNFRESA